MGSIETTTAFWTKNLARVPPKLDTETHFNHQFCLRQSEGIVWDA